MRYQNVIKYTLPALAVVLVMLVAAWAFNLPPVSAITDRDDGPVVSSTDDPGLLTDDQIDIIHVSGHGSATASPDLAELSLAVSVTEDTVVEARTTAATSARPSAERSPARTSTRTTSPPVTSESIPTMTTGRMDANRRASRWKTG